MSDFHMTLSPGLLTGLDHPIIIAFDEPDEATRVNVKLWEADRWRAAGERIREGTRNDMIAQFRGSIVDGKFQGRVGRKGRARRNAPVLKVRFDGQDEIHELPIPEQRNEQENGVFEIMASVAGRIGRRTKRYRTSTPVYIRQFGNRRPVVTLLTGKKGYFTHARRYWRRHADGVFLQTNVQSIFKFVRNASKSRGYGAFGELNVVSHGNRWEWLVRLFQRQKRRRGRRRTPNPYHLGLATVRQHSNDARLLPRPDQSQLDAKSRVVLRGCVLGQNQALLDQIRTLFGGKATVYAPKYIQWYASDSSGRLAPRESFHEQFFYYRRGHRRPSNRAAARILQAKYPGRFSNDEWLKLLKRKKVKKEKAGPGKFRYDNWPNAPKRDDVKADCRKAFNAKSEDERAGSTFDDWQWKIKIRRRRGRRNYRAILTGKRIRIEVRSPLKEADGSLTLPNLANAKHYGRSPSW